MIDQIKGEKVIHFVRRRRKHSSKRTKGHRQQLTLVRVTDILAAGGEAIGRQGGRRCCGPRRGGRRAGQGREACEGR